MHILKTNKQNWEGPETTCFSGDFMQHFIFDKTKHDQYDTNDVLKHEIQVKNDDWIHLIAHGQTERYLVNLTKKCALNPFFPGRYPK